MVDPSELVARGYAVFPVRLVPRPDGKIDKPPQPGVMWSRESTRDLPTVVGWLRRWPDTAWGIDCGKSEVVVIDVDPGGSWPETGPYTTPRGGTHVYYAEDRAHVVGVDADGRVAPHVDVRGMGGYVVAYGLPPRWGELQAVPARVVEAMARRPAPASTLDAPADPFSGPDRAFTREQAGAVVAAALDRLRAAPEGSRNSTLNDVAMTCGHFVPAFWPVDVVAERLAVIGEAIGLRPGEVTATMRSGLRAGMAQPFTLYEGGDAPKADEAIGDAADALIAEMLDSARLDEIPDAEPLISDVLMMDSIASIVGKSGKGKSFLTVDMACHVATGKPWHGRPVRRGLVVYIVAEGARGLKRRVRAWEKYHEVKPADNNVLFLPRPVQVASEEWLVLIEACRRLAPVAIVIDTQARVSVGIEENSAKEMGVFVDRAEALRAATGACIALVHHQGHAGEDGRGSTAIKGAMQTQISVAKDGELVTMRVTKQKDDSEIEPIMFRLVESGESVVLVAAGEAQPDGQAFIAPAELDNLPDDLTALVDVFTGTFGEGYGGTKAEVRAVYYTHPRIRGKTDEARRKAFARTWNRLVEMGRLVQVEGRASYRFISISALLDNAPD